MLDDPSDREGLRTAMTSETDPDSKRPSAARAGLGWLLIGLAIAIGFAVGTRMGVAVDVETEVATDTTSAVVRAAAIQRVAAHPDEHPASHKTAADLLLAFERSQGSAPEGGERTPSVAAAELGEFEDDFLNSVAPSSDASDEGDYQLSAFDSTPFAGREAAKQGAVPIEKLPVYQPDPDSRSSDGLTIVTRGEIREGESLGSSLRAQGISPGTVHLIAAEMRKVFDFRHSRPGDRYRLGQDSDGRVLDFRYSQSPEESFYLAWEGTRYVVRKESAELRPQIAKIAGVVDSSFYGAVIALGEQSSLASDFAQILAWDIDFSRSVHPGDEFQILYERLYRINPDGDDEYVKPGRILAGRYAGQNGEHTVVYFEDDDGKGAYFRPDGSSIERAFLVAPLAFSRITSRFTWARRHPILKVTRPHPGIDYAAPHGTPIWSVAEGVVEYKARAGASGNLIRVRHQNGLTSHYAHLARFAKGLKVGDRVEQKEIIGYVGSTGLSTGPHVCFRVKRDGRYVDPMKISGPAGEPVEKARLAAFHSVRDQLLADLGSGPLSVADEAL